MICPLCAATLPFQEATCPSCGADLTEYLTAKYQPDLLFNEALDCLTQENYSDACDLLCRAHAMRPDDTEILALRVRAEYLADNKKRAIELMSDLTELDDSPALAEQLDRMIAEYDAERMSEETTIQAQFQAQNERLAGLLDRMERCLETRKSADIPSPAERGSAEASATTPADFSRIMEAFPSAEEAR